MSLWPGGIVQGRLGGTLLVMLDDGFVEVPLGSDDNGVSVVKVAKRILSISAAVFGEGSEVVREVFHMPRRCQMFRVVLLALVLVVAVAGVSLAHNEECQCTQSGYRCEYVHGADKVGHAPLPWERVIGKHFFPSWIEL